MWNALSNATQRYLPALKVMLGMVLIALAAFLGLSM